MQGLSILRSRGAGQEGTKEKFQVSNFRNQIPIPEIFFRIIYVKPMFLVCLCGKLKATTIKFNQLKCLGNFLEGFRQFVVILRYTYW